MTSSSTTAAATQGVRCRSASPPRPSMSRISSVAYAFEDSGSLQKTGSASFLGSNVSPIRALSSGVPTRSRLGRVAKLVTSSRKHGPA